MTIPHDNRSVKLTPMTPCFICRTTLRVSTVRFRSGPERPGFRELSSFKQVRVAEVCVTKETDLGRGGREVTELRMSKKFRVELTVMGSFGKRLESWISFMGQK